MLTGLIGDAHLAAQSVSWVVFVHRHLAGGTYCQMQLQQKSFPIPPTLASSLSRDPPKSTQTDASDGG